MEKTDRAAGTPAWLENAMCSFCGKRRTEVRYIMVSPRDRRIFICGECVEAGHEAMEPVAETIKSPWEDTDECFFCRQPVEDPGPFGPHINLDVLLGILTPEAEGGVKSVGIWGWLCHLDCLRRWAPPGTSAETFRLPTDRDAS